MTDVAEAVREKVRAGYTATAQGTGTLVAPDPEGQALAFGYTADALSSVPEGTNLGLGCGNPTGAASLAAGQTVVDLGCGPGFDAFIASQAVGPTGRVIGVDMTAALLERARATARSGGYANVEFRLGTMEALPLDDGVADVVVSNCAINLSPEKERVFAEAVRVLRPGGRLQVSDLVVEEELPDAIRASVEAYVGCVGGATTLAEYTALVHGAGFEDVEVVASFALSDIITPSDPRVRDILIDAGVSFTDDEVRRILSTIKGVSVRATRPGADAGDVAAEVPTAGCCGPAEEGAVPAADAACCPPASTSVATSQEELYPALLSYVLSNAVAGEIMAVDNYSDMVALFDDIDEKLEAVTQAREEGRHIRQLASLGTRVGFDVQQRIIEPEWKAVRAAFRDAVARGDLAACLVIQDVMVESMAIVTYRSLSGADGIETDDATARTTAAILQDELEHLEIGITRLQRIRAQDPASVDRAVAWAHPLVMPQLMSLTSTSCETLCDVLDLDCGSLDPTVIGADLDLIRSRAAAQYADALDRIGIPASVSDPLLAHLGALEIGDQARRVDTGDTDRCC
jgi:SAM-dependent methyltransferase/rubrerythrin